MGSFGIYIDLQRIRLYYILMDIEQGRDSAPFSGTDTPLDQQDKEVVRQIDLELQHAVEQNALASFRARELGMLARLQQEALMGEPEPYVPPKVKTRSTRPTLPTEPKPTASRFLKKHKVTKKKDTGISEPGPNEPKAEVESAELEIWTTHNRPFPTAEELSRAWEEKKNREGTPKNKVVGSGRIRHPEESKRQDIPACKDMDPGIFLPIEESAEDVALAKSICQTCGVIAKCLDDAITRREPAGVWGGATTKERELMVRRK